MTLFAFTFLLFCFFPESNQDDQLKFYGTIGHKYAGAELIFNLNEVKLVYNNTTYIFTSEMELRDLLAKIRELLIPLVSPVEIVHFVTDGSKIIPDTLFGIDVENDNFSIINMRCIGEHGLEKLYSTISPFIVPKQPIVISE